MSDDEERSGASSGSESESEDIETTGLIATRAKRSTAGNLYASLRTALDDEDVRRDLLAEDEDDDAGDYEGSDKEDDDEALDESSDEEDRGPPKEGEAEDLTGEKELQKKERADARKKRKVQDARLKLPAWQKKNKKVKLADDVKTEDGSSEAPAPKPKKKSERSNWLPTAADAPLRQSGRALAVANREVIHANLKQSYERSEKQRKVMKNAAEREKTKKRQEISQEDRLKLCDKIAKQTDREFGRWERDEAERQRARDEALAAKRRRDVDGPFVRYWSGSAIWRGVRMEQGRVEHGSLKVEELKDEPKKTSPIAPAAALQPTTVANGSAATNTPATTSQATSPGSHQGSTHGHPAPTQTSATASGPSLDAPPAWLQGIHDYASQPATPTPAISQPPTHQAITQPYSHWPPGTQQPFQLDTAPALQAPPILREQAQRTLILLENFTTLDQTNKRKNAVLNPLEPTPPATVLLPDSYPPYAPDESRYLQAKYSARKKAGADNIPPAPEKTKCSIIPNKDAKYRDPKTGLPYLDLQCYKIIQRVLAGGCQWSSLLGAWIGPAYGAMGRPARGVPEGFGAPPLPSSRFKVEQGS